MTIFVKARKVFYEVAPKHTEWSSSEQYCAIVI